MNFRRRPILCTTLYRNPMQASNFGGTFDQLVLRIFLSKFHRRCLSTSSTPLCKKVKNDQKLKSRGVLPETRVGPTLVGGGWKGEKGHLRTHSACGGFVGAVSSGLGSRQKKGRNFIAEASWGLLFRRICCFSDTLTKSHEKRTHRSLSHERWSTDGNQTKKVTGSPTFPQLHVSERTESRVSQLNGDRPTESGLTTQVLLLKSLEINGDRRNHLSSWEENVERRLADPHEQKHGGPGFWTIRRSDLWIGPLRWAHLASFSGSVHASLSSHRQGIQGAGVNRDWPACTPDCRRSRSAAPGNTADKLRTDTHYCFIDILPWPKKSLQPRYSWDWSALQSCDIMRERLQSATRARDAQSRGSRRCRTQAWYRTISHD